MAERNPMPPRDRRKLDSVAPGKRSKYRDTKRWCRGKSGVPHEWAITEGSFSHSWPCKLITYYRTGGDANDSWWQCWHVESCVNCGKINRHFLNPGECPNMPPGTPTRKGLFG